MTLMYNISSIADGREADAGAAVRKFLPQE